MREGKHGKCHGKEKRVTAVRQLLPAEKKVSITRQDRGGENTTKCSIRQWGGGQNRKKKGTRKGGGGGGVSHAGMYGKPEGKSGSTKILLKSRPAHGREPWEKEGNGGKETRPENLSFREGTKGGVKLRSLRDDCVRSGEREERSKGRVMVPGEETSKYADAAETR